MPICAKWASIYAPCSTVHPPENSMTNWLETRKTRMGRLTDKYCIVGVGETAYTKDSGKTARAWGRGHS